MRVMSKYTEDDNENPKIEGGNAFLDFGSGDAMYYFVDSKLHKFESFCQL